MREGRRGCFADVNDKDYRAIFAMIGAGKKRLEELTRFDMPTFRPEPAYLREMKRYGVLPASFAGEEDRVNVYELDQKYFELLWYRPAPEGWSDGALGDGI